MKNPLVYFHHLPKAAKNFDCSSLPFPAAWAAPIHGPVDVETHFVTSGALDFEQDNKRSMFGFKIKLVIMEDLKRL